MILSYLTVRFHSPASGIASVQLASPLIQVTRLQLASRFQAYGTERGEAYPTAARNLSVCLPNKMP